MAVFEHDEESKLETDPLSSGELYMLVLVMYTMFAGGISAVLLASVAVGLFTLILTESLLLTLAISILFPIFDQKVEKNIGFGVFRATSSVILAFFEMLTEMYRLSHSILDQARYQRRRLIQ